MLAFGYVFAMSPLLAASARPRDYRPWGTSVRPVTHRRPARADGRPDRMVDLHCHYPMHLLARAPREVIREMTRVGGRPRWLDRLRAAVVLLAARALNFARWRGGWRVGLRGLERGGVQVVCSVLYDPFAEIDLDESYGARPEPGYYDDLLQQLGRVEDDLRRIDPQGKRHVLVRTKADLDSALQSHRVGFVHCIEGGFHLGSTPEEVTKHVAELAERGVRYVTLAHLFW